MEVLILGAGTFAETVSEWCRACGIQVVGFVVDVGPKPDTLAGLPVWWAGAVPPRFYAGGIFSPKREGLVAKLNGYRFVKVMHPDASVAQTAGIDVGTVVGPGAVVDRRAHLEKHVVVNRGCLIGHHVHIREFATLGPGANLAGNVEVGRGALIGMGACVLPGLSIGAGAIVGVGSVVVRDVPPGTTVMGVPAS